MNYDECGVCGAERSTKISLCDRCGRLVDEGTYFTVGDFCDDCPLLNKDNGDFGGYSCSADGDEREVDMADGDRSEGTFPRPDWCPLRVGGVIVVEATKAELEAEGV